jgi:tripartite-type tricarboxylate transporter receptor subunit TctC
MIRYGAAMLAAIFVLFAATQVDAQTKFPTKPIRILVPFAPGGTIDITARILAEHLRQVFGESVVVENKPGASGIVAIEEMMRSKPDGHTVMVGNISTNGLTPLLLAKTMKVDYAKDVTIVARVSDARSIFTSTNKSDFPPKNMTELIAYAKERPGKVMFTSTGPGSIQQLDFSLLMKRTGVEFTHIPFKGGGAEMLKSMATGDTHLAVGPYAASRSLIPAGLIRPIAIVGDKPIDGLPGIQTMAEAGYPDIGSDHWQVMVAPSGTPSEILDALHKAVAEVVAMPAVVDAYTKAILVPPPRLDRAQTQAWMAKEFDKWRKAIADLKIDVEQ